MSRWVARRSSYCPWTGSRRSSHHQLRGGRPLIPGMGTLLNTATVLTGGVIGITGGRRMPARVHHGLVAVLGLFTTVYGVRTALSPAFTGVGAPDLAVVLLSLLVGTALGSAIDIHGLLER